MAKNGADNKERREFATNMKVRILTEIYDKKTYTRLTDFRKNLIKKSMP